MRSRFSAFARGDADYLWKTLHPNHEDRSLREADVRRSIKATASSLRFMRLHVLDRRGPDETGTAKVLFLAEVFEKGKDRSFLELSSFRHDGAGWRYVEGALRPAPEVGEGAKGLSIEAFERSATRGK